MNTEVESNPKQLTVEEAITVQQRVYQMTVPKLATTFDPPKLFGNDKNRLKKAYDGHDVTTPQGRHDWHMKVLPLNYSQACRNSFTNKTTNWRHSAA